MMGTQGHASVVLLGSTEVTLTKWHDRGPRSRARLSSFQPQMEGRRLAWWLLHKTDDAGR